MLESYAELLRKWQARLNLVGAKTVDKLWVRHFLDSAQLLPLLPQKPGAILDMGSGAGFPGLVLAILLRPQPDWTVSLVEADARKCAFLRVVAAELDLPVVILNTRLEALDRRKAPPATGTPAVDKIPVKANGAVSGQLFDVITARALAPLPQLLDHAAVFSHAQSRCLFLKGQTVADELRAAQAKWMFQVRRLSSQSDPSGTILVIETLHRRSPLGLSRRAGSREPEHE